MIDRAARGAARPAMCRPVLCSPAQSSEKNADRSGPEQSRHDQRSADTHTNAQIHTYSHTLIGTPTLALTLTNTHAP